MPPMPRCSRCCLPSPFSSCAVRAGSGSPISAFFVSLLFFLLDYPVGSLSARPYSLPLPPLRCCLARPAERAAARWGFAKIVAMVAILLLAPPLRLLSSWSALIQVSARVVFSGEIFAYGNDHMPPFMWTRTPWPCRVCILVGLSVLLFNRRWPRPLRTAAATLCLVVGGVQLGALVKYLGLDAGLVDRLPRLHYFEFYMPLFYAVCGGFALHHWRDLLLPCRATRARIVCVGRGGRSCSSPLAFLHPAESRRSSLPIFGWARAFVCARRREKSGAPRRRLGGAAPARRGRRVCVLIVAGAIGTWLAPTADIFPIFFAFSRCRERRALVPRSGRDDDGRGRQPDHPVFAARVECGRPFRGPRRDPGQAARQVRTPGAADMRWTQALFDRFHAWYARAYERQAIKGSSSGELFSPAPAAGALGPAPGAPRRHCANLCTATSPSMGPSRRTSSWRCGDGSGARPRVRAGRDRPHGPVGWGSLGAGAYARSAPPPSLPRATASCCGRCRSRTFRSPRRMSRPSATSIICCGPAMSTPACRRANRSIPPCSRRCTPSGLALLGVRFVVARDSKVYEIPSARAVNGMARLLGLRGARAERRGLRRKRA